MGDWSYLWSLLAQVQVHSTVVGRVWMSVLFLFRVFVLGSAVDKVWGDELSQFSCTSAEPGCSHACYNFQFPVSPVHFWMLQVLLVSTPTLAYLAHAVHLVRREERRSPGGGSAPGVGGRPRLRGALLLTYVLQLLAKLLLEAAFGAAYYFLFGSVPMASRFHCLEAPCPVSGGAECFVSRPTEKSVFVVFMLAAAGVSALLNVVELLYLLAAHRRRKRRERSRTKGAPLQRLPRPEGGAAQGVYAGLPLRALPRLKDEAGSQNGTLRREKHA